MNEDEIYFPNEVVELQIEQGYCWLPGASTAI